jgi:hypothetical protein
MLPGLEEQLVGLPEATEEAAVCRAPHRHGWQRKGDGNDVLMEGDLDVLYSNRSLAISKVKCNRRRTFKSSGRTNYHDIEDEIEIE